MEIFDEDNEIEQIISYYRDQRDAAGQENLVAMLREIQELLGCVPADIQELAAASFMIKPNVLQQLVKLYPSLSSAPSRHKITLCVGVNCSAAQSAALLETIRGHISGKPFRLTAKSCLKQCRTAPNMTIDQDLYPSVTPEQIPTILARYC